MTKDQRVALLVGLGALALVVAGWAQSRPMPTGTATVGPLEPVGPIGNTDPNPLGLDPTVTMPPYVPIDQRAPGDPIWGSGKPLDLGSSGTFSQWLATI